MYNIILESLLSLRESQLSIYALDNVTLETDL